MINPEVDKQFKEKSTDVSGEHRSKYSLFEGYYTQSEFLTTFQRELLLNKMQDDLRPEYRRRIEIMLLADMGYSQTQICTTLGCSQEMARYWTAKAQVGQAHHWDDRPLGRPKTVNAEYLERLKELVNHSPREYGYSFRCWTAEWLSKHLAKEFGIEVSDRHINRLLQKLGISTRQKRKSTEQTTVQTPKESSITIKDLQSSPSPSFLWPFDLINTSR